MTGAELRRTKAATATTTTSTSSPLSKTRISTSSLNSELSSNSSKCGSVVCRRHGLGSNDSSNDRAAISDDNDETTTASSTSTSSSMMIAPLIDRDVESHPNDDYSDDDDDEYDDDGEFVKNCRRRLLTWRLTLSSLSPPSPPSSLSLDDHFIFRKTQRKSRRRALLCASILLLLLFLYALRLLFLKGRPLLMERPAFLYGGKTLASSQVQACMLPEDHLFPEDFVRPHAPTWEWYVWEDMMIANTTVAPRTEPPPPKTPVLQEGSQQVQRPRLLIAQYSGYGDYSRMLDLTLPVHLAYAKQWHADVLVVQGTTLDLSAHGVNETCNKPGPRATFNKLAILERALQLKHRYDFLLILDTDAMIVDLDTDFTTQLLPLTHALAAHRVYAFDKVDTWDINAGVTLWNLHHPQTKPLSDAWTEMTLRHIPQVLMSNDDQFFLQRVLLLRRKQRRKRRSINIVYSLTKAFAYSDGTIIKHFKRQARSWKDTGIDGRLHQIQQAMPPITATTTLMMKPSVIYADRKAPGV